MNRQTSLLILLCHKRKSLTKWAARKPFDEKSAAMRRNFLIVCCIAVLLGIGFFTRAAETRWTGLLTDSYCAASPAQMTAAHKMTERDCAIACVKPGAKWVFNSQG